MHTLKKYYKYFTLASLSLFIDQAIKLIWPKFLPIGETYFITDRFSLTHIQNYGIIGEKYSQYPVGQIEAYTLYWPLFLLFMLFVLAKKRFYFTSFVERIGYTLMLSGGSSNLLDHWLRRHVIDTFRIDWTENMSQPFNFADMLLLLGATLLILRFTALWFKSQGKVETPPLVHPTYWDATEER